jgi:hypothetical protein
MYPPIRDRRSGLGRLAWWLFWLLMIIYVLRHPSEAAANVQSVGMWLGNASESIFTFLRHATGSR